MSTQRCLGTLAPVIACWVELKVSWLGWGIRGRMSRGGKMSYILCWMSCGLADLVTDWEWLLVGCEISFLLYSVQWSLCAGRVGDCVTVLIVTCWRTLKVQVNDSLVHANVLYFTESDWLIKIKWCGVGMVISLHSLFAFGPDVHCHPQIPLSCLIKIWNSLPVWTDLLRLSPKKILHLVQYNYIRAKVLPACISYNITYTLVHLSSN